MVDPYITYIYSIYGIVFLVLSLMLMHKIRQSLTHHSKDIFWAFTAFASLKAMSILIGSSIEFFAVDSTVSAAVLGSLSEITSEISHIFLFHFGISILTFRTSFGINYKIFPIILLFIYAVLNLSGIIEPYDAERISRNSFGFSGAVLASIGFFNIYSIKAHHGDHKHLSGLVICSISLLCYAFSEGILSTPLWGIPVELFRLASAMVLLNVPLFITTFLDEDKTRRVGFV